MRRVSGLKSLACLLLLATVGGCGMSDHMSNMDDNTKVMASELQNDRSYIQSLSEQMKVLAESLSALQRSSSGLFEAVMAQFRRTEPDNSPNIDDVIKGPSGASGTSGTSGASGASGTSGTSGGSGS